MSFRLNQRLLEIAKSPDQIIGVDQSGLSVSGGPWLADVLKISQTLKPQSESTLQIFSEDALQFLKFFLAAIIAGKKPILLPNQQPETLAHYNKIFPVCCQGISALPSEANSTDLLAAGELTTLPDLDASPLLLFTSGTTGEPKEVEKRVSHLVNEIEVLEGLFGLSKNSTFVATVSHQHVYGLLFRLWWPFLTGRKVMSQTLEFPEQFSGLDESESHLSLVTTPSFLKRLDENSAKHLRGVRTLFSSGGPLPQRTSQDVGRWLGHFPWEIYGSTESGGIAYRRGTAEGQPTWRLFPGVTGNSDSQGRLSIASPFIGEPTLEMGDEVRWVSKNQFELMGRVDRVLKVEETRVSLTEMESFFAEHSWVESAFLLNSKKGRQEVWGVVQLTDSGAKALAQNGRFQTRQFLRQHLQNRFPPVVLPRRLRYIQNWPFNSRGKLDLNQLQELFND